ncbi:Uncharacterised protein [Burkholderia pseudomallei]|nr:hypothetical protein Y597_6121 [Burkholderia pseudomallei MSHR1000]KGW61350.1 hypothetical protein Y039_5606 [Burkholderia pseudomallei MSHR1029]OAG65263.1 hypothetical protein BIM11_6149 [Burkholderia pseudomallei]CAJ2761620.1 Uncharacterised protein [Burkholderia pseudomallei]CAJ2899060.1 Uncharacterised protein [Burkholderia pseudomallei]
MPAFDTRMSTEPNVWATLSMPAFTASSFVTSIATPIARPPACSMSSATAFAPSWFRSAIATAAPARASSSAISLPMPLAAPVTMAAFPFKFEVIPQVSIS